MNLNKPSKMLIEQRIRNRLIEYLEMVVEWESTPPAFDLNELINIWEDWVHRPISGNYFPGQVYTKEEDELLRCVDSAWDALCNATPQTIEDENAVKILPEWKLFINASSQALTALRRRGRLSEEEEIRPI